MRPFHSFLMLADVLSQAPGAAGQATGINSTAVRPEIGVDWPAEGELPQQNFGDFQTLMPAALTFQLPLNLAQLWHPFEAEDKRPGSKTYGQKVERWMLKFDKANPLIVSNGPHTGQPLTATIGTNPRPRGGKTDDPKTPWVADTSYLLAVCLKDPRRPVSVEELKAILNSYAGKEIRLKTGLSGQCRPDAVVREYFYDPTDTTFQAEGREQKTVVLENPGGRKGCGARYYTNPSKNRPTAFKNPSPKDLTDQYFTEIQCSGEIPNPLFGQIGQPEKVPCNAVIRGWPSIDEFLPPLGA
jgi:hypothetical protein